jgi:hypothetical protein
MVCRSSSSQPFPLTPRDNSTSPQPPIAPEVSPQAHLWSIDLDLPAASLSAAGGGGEEAKDKEPSPAMYLCPPVATEKHMTNGLADITNSGGSGGDGAAAAGVWSQQWWGLRGDAYLRAHLGLKRHAQTLKQPQPPPSQAWLQPMPVEPHHYPPFAPHPQQNVRAGTSNAAPPPFPHLQFPRPPAISHSRSKWPSQFTFQHPPLLKEQSCHTSPVTRDISGQQQQQQGTPHRHRDSFDYGHSSNGGRRDGYSEQQQQQQQQQQGTPHRHRGRSGSADRRRGAGGDSVDGSSGRRGGEDADDRRRGDISQRRRDDDRSSSRRREYRDDSRHWNQQQQHHHHKQSYYGARRG